MEKILALELVKVTEAAAIAAAHTMGQGDRKLADKKASEAMRQIFNELDICGRIVIGEGERDEAPMLYIGEKVGCGQSQKCPNIDIAVDPLEGTNLVATGTNNAISVLAISESGGLLHAPDIYMEKLVVTQEAAGQVDINAPVKDNLKKLAKALDYKIEDLTVVVLDRERHEKLIADIRRAGARIKLIGDGDLGGAIAAVIHGNNIHALMGFGGAPEGVLAAAAIKCLKGYMQATFVIRDNKDKERLEKIGGNKPGEILGINDLAPGNDIIFVATGVTDGDFLKGVRFFGGGARTETLMTSFKSGKIRFIDTTHVFDREEIKYYLKT